LNFCLSRGARGPRPRTPRTLCGNTGKRGAGWVVTMHGFPVEAAASAPHTPLGGLFGSWTAAPSGGRRGAGRAAKPAAARHKAPDEDGFCIRDAQGQSPGRPCSFEWVADCGLPVVPTDEAHRLLTFIGARKGAQVHVLRRWGDHVINERCFNRTRPAIRRSSWFTFGPPADKEIDPAVLPARPPRRSEARAPANGRGFCRFVPAAERRW